MEEYSYPSGDAAAFTEEMNEKLAPVLRIREGDSSFSPTFEILLCETSYALEEEVVVTDEFINLVRRIGEKYWRAGATWSKAGTTFWFFAQV